MNLSMLGFGLCSLDKSSLLCCCSAKQGMSAAQFQTPQARLFEVAVQT